MPYFDIETSIALKMAFSLEYLDLHISRNFKTTLCWFMSKIFTVTEVIFSSPWSLLPLLPMLKQLIFIWPASVFCSSGAMAWLRMHKALVFPQVYAFAIFGSEKMFLNNGPKWFAVANGRLCSPRKPVTLSSVTLTSLSRSEPTATKCCVIGLWAFCYLTNLHVFYSAMLSNSTFPWCSTGVDLSQIKQKLYKVFCGCVFLMISVYFSLNQFSRKLNLHFPYTSSALFSVSSQE